MVLFLCFSLFPLIFSHTFHPLPPLFPVPPPPSLSPISVTPLFSFRKQHAKQGITSYHKTGTNPYMQDRGCNPVRGNQSPKQEKESEI